jgi:hypothetical protein
MKLSINQYEAERRNREMFAMNAVTSELVARNLLASKLGITHAGKRDLYGECGYPEKLQFADFANRYKRQGIARRINNAYPNATWNCDVSIYETEKDTETKFETILQEMTKRLRLFHYFKRVDRITGIGKYGCLVIGFDDGKEAHEPVENPKGVLYVKPYKENQITIEEFEEDTTNERYGKPLMYKIKSKANVNKKTASSDKLVHWSRVIHVVDGCEDDDVYGVPRLEAVYNNLQNIETLSGGSTEMFWKGGFPGVAFEMDAGATVTSEVAKDMKAQVEEYMHSLRRYLSLQGVKANPLTPQVASPKAPFEMELTLISIASEIPKRILEGSERGELASSQDAQAWNERVHERRKDYAEPVIIRQFIDRLIEVGILPEVEEYYVKWPEVNSLDPKDKAEITKKRIEVMAEYVNSGLEALMTPFHFLTIMLDFTDDEAEAILKQAEEEYEEEDDEGASLEPEDDDAEDDEDDEA